MTPHISLHRALRVPALALILAVVLAAPAHATPADCNVPTAAGPVAGTLLDKPGLCEYRGIPYAAPPTGDLRFALPQPHAPWTEPLQAAAFGPMCFQFPFGLFPATDPAGSEDCLVMNIWQPVSANDNKKPVMLYIHGGGFVNGSTDMDLYNGARLAATGDVIVVTFNYRLGPFGFFSLPALRADERGGTNFGLHDQLAAMRWVKDNIAHFGGDPDNITLFGESAGGVSVGVWLMTPEAEGLFSKAIMQSGPMVMLNSTLAKSDEVSAEVAERVGCAAAGADAAACLRAVPAARYFDFIAKGFAQRDDDEITNESKRFTFQPSIDGTLIRDKPFALLARGAFRKNIPLMIGINHDEASLFTMSRKIGSRDDLRASLDTDLKMIEERFGIALSVDGMMALYNETDYPDPKVAYNSMFTDMGFICPSKAMARTLAGAGVPVYFYLFNKPPDTKGMAKNLGAFHGSELPFVFGNFSFMGLNFKSKDNTELSRDMMALWSAFAHNGTPAAPGWPQWTPYGADADPYLHMQQQGTIETGLAARPCAAFDELIKNDIGE